MKKIISIKWTNTFSGETGYVASIRKTKGYFENTFEQEKARKFKSVKEANNAIAALNEMGEGENNTFEVVEITL